jgi:uncharacterized SAM-binding protein YcdF (DUF218 family)
VFVNKFSLFCQKYYFLVLISFCLSLLLVIPVKIAIALQREPYPQGMLVLGGEPKREVAAAELAKCYPKLDTWISSGPDSQETQKIFQSAGISSARVHIDQQATDTVTNFTTLVKDFQQVKIHHLYLITSDYHMSRAKAIAYLILGSHDITFTPISIPSNSSPESPNRILRDIIRSLIWVVSGYTLSR